KEEMRALESWPNGSCSSTNHTDRAMTAHSAPSNVRTIWPTRAVMLMVPPALSRRESVRRVADLTVETLGAVARPHHRAARTIGCGSPQAPCEARRVGTMQRPRQTDSVHGKDLGMRRWWPAASALAVAIPAGALTAGRAGLRETLMLLGVPFAFLLAGSLAPLLRSPPALAGFVWWAGATHTAAMPLSLIALGTSGRLAD